MRMKIVMATAALAALSACGQGSGGGYPEASRQAFLSSCKASAPAPICDCALKKIEGKFTFAQFTEWNTALEQGREHPLSEQALTLTMECGQDYIKSGGQ